MHAQVPRFRLPAVGGGAVDLEDVLRESAALLVFHHGAWCQHCVRLLVDLAAEVNGRCHAAPLEILAISNEGARRSSALLHRLGRAFPLLADETNHVTAAYQLLNGRRRFSIWLEGQRVDVTACVVLVERDGSVAWTRPIHAGRIAVEPLFSAVSCRHAS
jgi:peroxiredoxin